MSEFPLGVDISAYQYSSDGKQKPNFDLINQTCDFVAVRAGISWGYTDQWFSYTWQHLSVPRLAYHVIYPGEDARRQTDHFLNIVKPGEHDRLVLDMELDHGYNKTRITDTLEQCLVELWDETGRYPIIYSRASWVNQFLDVSRLPKLDWWLAGYRKRLPEPLYTPEATPPPALPKGVDNWLIHQTCERGNGSEFGVASHYVDIDRWNTGNKEIAAFFGLGEETPPELPEPEPPEEPVKLFDAKVVTKPGYRLRTRFTPGGNLRPVADWLQSQAIVPVYETSGTGWWRVGHETWASSEWMQRLDLPQPITEKYYGALYWQRDPRWKDKPLGTSGTIGSYGCVMTAETNALNQLGIVTNPVVNNAWRTANGGYHNGNLIVWEKVTEQHPSIIWEGKTWNPTDAQIKQKIADGCPLVMLVDHNEGTPALDEHWVNSIPSPADDDAIWIHDPWDNSTIRLRDRYKKPIQQFSSYRKQM